MARRRPYRPEPEADPQLEMSPLIDVSFLLLIYFLVTSTLQPREADLGLELPSDSPSSNPLKLDPMTINVNEQGQVFVQDEQVENEGGTRDLNNLLEKVARYKSTCEATDSQPVIIVAADDTGKHQRFTDVVNTLAKAGIKNVTLTGFRKN